MISTVKFFIFNKICKQKLHHFHALTFADILYRLRANRTNRNFICNLNPKQSKINTFMKTKKNITTQLKRIEHKCDRMTILLTKLNRMVRGQVVDSLIDTMRQEAMRMKEMSRIERERTAQANSDGLHK